MLKQVGEMEHARGGEVVFVVDKSIAVAIQLPIAMLLLLGCLLQNQTKPGIAPDLLDGFVKVVPLPMCF